MSPPHWRELPFELRCRILKEVLEDVAEASSSSSTREHKSLATYATVSYEWQLFFEKANFNQLVLSSDDLDDFRSVIVRRQPTGQALYMQIRRIWLRISLSRYHQDKGSGARCRGSCSQPENDEEVMENDKMFTNAMQHLLQTLALIPANRSGRGLTLEFSASSPSDAEHCFKSWYHLQSDYPYAGTLKAQSKYIDETSQKRWYDTYDPEHGWGTRSGRRSWARNLAGPQGQNIRCGYSKRLIRPLKFTSNLLKLPEVKIVNSLVIRRQFFRDISTRSLRKLLQSLPNLQVLRRENWRLPHNMDRATDDRSYAVQTKNSVGKRKHAEMSRYLLLPSLPRSLRHLQLFEDFGIQLHGKEDVEQPRSSRIELLPSLTVSTPCLTRLAVSFVTDAIDCFGLRDSYMDEGGIPDSSTFLFPHMEEVILTSQEHLRPDQDRSKVNALLGAAAAVALKMPKLRVMELWNCGQGQACVFRYDSRKTRSAHEGTITWRSNWASTSGMDLIMQADVIKAWEKVILTNHSHACWLLPKPIRVEYCPLPTERMPLDYSTYGYILEHLKLARIALHLTSVMQARKETYWTPDKTFWYE